MSTTPAKELDKIIVRLPDGMRDRLTEAARENNRSVNAEVVMRLGLTINEIGAGLNAYGISALVRRLEANAEATESIARGLIYELYLANGIGAEKDERISEAVDVWRSQQKNQPSRPIAIRMLVERALTEFGYLNDLMEQT